MNNFFLRGIYTDVKLTDKQTISLDTITFFPQYDGHCAEDVYNFIDMDPWNEDIFDVYSDDIGGDVLDLITEDFIALSYTGIDSLKEKDPDLYSDYEKGIADEADILEGYAFDIIWECSTEDEEWRQEYIQYLEKLTSQFEATSNENKIVLQDLINNAKEPFKDNIVVAVYKIGVK